MSKKLFQVGKFEKIDNDIARISSGSIIPIYVGRRCLEQNVRA